MECDVCSKLEKQLRRESEIEARAILEQRSRWISGTPDGESDAETELTVLAIRKRRMAIASSLEEHTATEHAGVVSKTG